MARAALLRTSLVVFFFAAAGSAARADLWDRFEFDTELELEWATDLDSGDAQMLQGTLKPEIEVDLPWGLSLMALGRLRGDVYDRMWRGKEHPDEVSSISRSRALGDRASAELRELFVQGRAGDVLFRLGKQQVVWGQADGLKVLDVVNPQSFREFILDDFEDSRIPLWTVNLEVPFRDVVAQFLWIPDPSFHALAPKNSVFAFTAEGLAPPPPPPGFDLRVRNPDRPKNFARDSDAGVRLSTFAGGWDLTLNYLYHYDDFPVPFRNINTAGTTPTITITPKYRRTHLVGTTFTNAFGDLTLRGELGYNFDLYFSTDRVADSDGVVETDELGYVLGLDWYGFDETVVSGQFFQSWLPRRGDGLIRKENEFTVTLLLRRDFLNDALIFETLWIHGIREGDGLQRVKLIYEILSGLNGWIGVDWFYGTKNGAFGQFDDKDRVVVGLEWGF